MSNVRNPNSPRSMESRVCSFYINACPPPGVRELEKSHTVRRLPMQKLCESIQNLNLEGNWWLGPTTCGLVLSFNRLEEANILFDTVEIAKVLDGPVQVACLPTKLMKLSSTPISRLTLPIYLAIRDVPWSIPVEDIATSLEMQGIQPIKIERLRQSVRIELNNLLHSEYLLRDGFDFYGVAKFPVVVEKSWNLNDPGDNDVPQCYKCQGFWHVAVNCRHLPRCVRCGDTHIVEYCTRPRNDPLCCNCSGPHHAAFKNCPVRKQMAKATPVSFILSTERPAKSLAPLSPNLSNSKSRCLL